MRVQGCVHDEQLEPVALRPKTKASFDVDGPATAPCAAEGNHGFSRLLQLWWNGMDMGAAEDAPLRPVSTDLLMPEQVPRLVQADGIGVRVLAGTYQGLSSPLRSAEHHPILILHVRIRPASEGVVGPLTSAFNGFAWITAGGPCVFGKGSKSLAAAHMGGMGMVLLPPGGSDLHIQNEAEIESELLIALGRPQRKPHVKYVGYGGAFIHRTIEQVEAAMAEYEADPTAYGRSSAASAAKDVAFDAYKMVGGFQDNEGEMFERPEGGAPARFTRAVANA